MMINLYRMRQLMRQVPRKLWQIEQEEARATKITTVLTGMPRGGSGRNQVEEGAIKLAELKEAYAETLVELHYMRIELEPLISELDNTDDRAVMRLRYIQGFSPEDIAESIHRTDRSIYYYLSRAENEICRRHPEKVKANG